MNLGTKRTKCTQILPGSSKWPDVSQICRSRDACQKLRPSTRSMQFVLTSRSSWWSLLICKLGAAPQTTTERMLSLPPPHALHFRGNILTPRGCLEESESGAAPFGGVRDRRTLERYTEKARARFSSHARKPASTVTRTSSRSTCRSDYCARIAGAHKLVNQKGGRQSRCAGLLEPEKLNPRLRSLDRYSDSETWNIARVQAIGLAPQSRSATVKPAFYGCRY